MFSERVFISPGMINTARKSGSTVIRVSRLFSDGINEHAASIELPLFGQGGADLSLSRIELRFDNQQSASIVDLDSTLRVVATLNYTGKGLLRAIWEYAPINTGAAALFRPVPPRSNLNQTADPLSESIGSIQSRTRISQYLSSFQRTVLYSPRLPTGLIGQYAVRLRIDDSFLSFEAPTLQYFVGTPLKTDHR